MALQEAFYERYEMPKTETTTFEYNIDNLCQVYNADYEKTSRSWYLEHLCKTINITTTPKQGPIPFLNSYYSSSNDTDSIKNIFKRSIIDNGRIRFDTRMRSVSKKIRRIPIDLHFNNSEFTDQKHPNFDLYNARRKVWFNTTFGNHPRSNYAQNQFQRSNWRFYTNLTTYIPNFKRYFQNKKMWFNRTNDMHYRRNYEIPGNYPEKQHNKWFLRETLKELKQNHKKVTFSSRFQRQKARLKESNLIPNFDERDVIKQRFRWGDKPYIPRIDKYTAQKVLFQHENPDQSIEDRENEIARKLHINKLIPVHMSLLDEVTDPDLMSEYDYLDVKRYKPPYDPTNNINLTYNSEFQVNSHRDIKLHDKKPRNDPKETEKRRIKHNMYKMEFYEANGDYRKYPNLDALKQRRVISLLDEPVEDDSVMQDFLMTTHLPVANKTIDRAFEIFIEAQKSITTEVTKFKMMDEYNRTYIHDVKLNKTYYPQIRRHMISFNENETDTHTYEKYTIERQNYYNLSLDIMFTHYVFSTMKHDNITCTYGRMSNVINRWYNKTYYPYYRPSVFRKKYNIAIDRNYVQLLRNLENINEFYQNKIKIMNIDIENITSKVEREKVTVRVHKEMTTVKEKTTEVVREEESTVKEHVIETTTDKFIAQEREKVTVEIDTESGVKEERIKDIDGEVDDFLSAEEMMKLLIKRKEIRRKEYDELMKRSTTTIRPTSVATTKPIHAVTHKMSIKTTTKKPTTTTDLPTITTTTTVLPTSKKLTTETTSTTEKIPTTKKISTTITPARTTLNYPDFELTVEPTEPIEEPKSFLKTLLSRIKPLKIIKSWFSWGKKKPEKSE